MANLSDLFFSSLRPTPLLLLVLLLFIEPSLGLNQWSVQMFERPADLLRLSDTQAITFAFESHVLFATKFNEAAEFKPKVTVASELMEAYRASVQTEDGGYLILGTSTFNSTTGVSSLVLLKTDADFRKLWERFYPELKVESRIVQRHLFTSRCSNGTYYLLSGESAAIDGISRVRITAVSAAESNVVWSREFELPFIAHEFVLGRTHGNELLVTAYWPLEMQLIAISAETHEVVSRNSYAIIDADCALETADGGVAILGHIHSRQIISLIKLDKHRNMTWEKDIISPRFGWSAQVIETSDGGFVIFGMRADTPTTVVHGGLMVGIDANGTQRWFKTFTSAMEGIITQLVEMAPRVYIGITDASMFSVFKYTLPTLEERQQCGENLDTCKACASGFFFNRTVCLSCPRNCRECTAIHRCSSCITGYVLHHNRSCVPSAGRRPLPCNCSSPRLSPECKSKCVLPFCVLGNSTSLPHTDSNGTARCVCPADTSLRNATHCLALMKGPEHCPALCGSCTISDVVYCRTCVGLPRVMTHRTGKDFVDCQCEYGYLFNGTQCVYTLGKAQQLDRSGSEIGKEDRPGKRGKKEGGATTWAIIAGVLIAAAAIAWIAHKRCHAGSNVPAQSLGSENKRGSAEMSVTIQTIQA